MRPDQPSCRQAHPLDRAHSAAPAVSGMVVYVVCGWQGCARRLTLPVAAWEAEVARRAKFHRAISRSVSQGAIGLEGHEDTPLRPPTLHEMSAKQGGAAPRLRPFVGAPNCDKLRENCHMVDTRPSLGHGGPGRSPSLWCC